MRHNILYGGQVGTAGRPVKYPYPLPPQPGLCNVCRMWFCIVCWNMHGRSWKRCLLEGSILCSKISMYFSALMVPSQKWKLPLPRALTQPPYHDRPCFGLVAGNSLDDPFLLWSGAHGVHSSQKNTWNTDSSDHSTRFHCVMVHPRCLRAQRKSTALLDTVNLGLLLAQYSFNWHLWM